MKTNKITQAISALVLAGIALPAVAAGQDGWYLGAGGGAARTTIAENDIRNDLTDAGYEVTDYWDDDSDFGYQFFVGYQFNENFALEGGYFDFGNFHYDVTTLPEGTKYGELDFKGWNLDLLGILPLTERASIFASIGTHRAKSDVNFSGTGAVNVLTPHYSETNTDYKFGVGYQYQMTQHFGFRIEAERYHMDDSIGNQGDIDFYSLSFVYRFGGSSQAAMAPAREKQPAVPVSATAATEQYCGSLEIEFEIANDDIQRVNREHMRVLATFLEKYPETNVVIEGHTDSVGNDADNLRLSTQRAQTAVDYLVREHAIARDRLRAVGYGETRPIADNSTDLGKQANRRIHAVIGCATDIAGLQPLPARISLAMELEFATNGSTIDPKYHDQLASIGKYLQTNPQLTATLEGHTDNASPDMAEKISRVRAQSVADYLVTEFGISRSRLTVEGFGGTRRETYNVTASERQENRRVNIIIGYPK